MLPSSSSPNLFHLALLDSLSQRSIHNLLSAARLSGFPVRAVTIVPRGLWLESRGVKPRLLPLLHLKASHQIPQFWKSIACEQLVAQVGVALEAIVKELEQVGPHHGRPLGGRVNLAELQVAHRQLDLVEVRSGQWVNVAAEERRILKQRLRRHHSSRACDCRGR